MEKTESKHEKDLERMVTLKDLEKFKTELFELLKPLLKSKAITQPQKKWLKTNEVRKILDISAGKLITLRVNGTLPFTRIGGVIYYDQEDIEIMFSSRKFQHK